MFWKAIFLLNLHDNGVDSMVSIDQFRLPLPDLVAIWEEKYAPKTKKRFNITAINVNRKCLACPRTTLLNRHHKGFDSLWARARPDLWARRYIEFRPRDIVILCNECHKLCHLWLRNLEQVVVDLVYERYYTPGCRVLLTKNQCESLRRRMIKATNEWMEFLL